MLIVTAPSKSQTRVQLPTELRTTTPEFQDRANAIMEHLRNYDTEALSTLLKTSAALTRTSEDRIRNFTLHPTREKSHPALFTFSGDAWDALTPNEYTYHELSWAQEHVRILSGLYGCLRPLDLMQQYRLEMATKLTVDQASSLYQYWKECITTSLNAQLQKLGGGPLFNLASLEYSRVVDKKRLVAPMVTVSFKQHHKGKLKSIPIYSKRARGKMIHWLLRTQPDQANKVTSFREDGYRFSENLSEKTDWIFVQQIRT